MEAGADLAQSSFAKTKNAKSKATKGIRGNTTRGDYLKIDIQN